MKKLLFAVLVVFMLATTLAGQTPSDKVLTDRATALVKGLRDGNSWNKTVADLKKDFPDLKELEPFKIEGSEIQTQEFGALYNFDTTEFKKYTGHVCSDFPNIKFSFYQNKLYRVETFYGVENYKFHYNIAYAFFGKDSIETDWWTLRENGIRVSKDYFMDQLPEDFRCVGQSKYGLRRIVYTNISIERIFYADQNILHPEWGYVNIKWGDSFKEVANVYKDLVAVSDKDSIYGVKIFRQSYKSGDINFREFTFYHDSLFQAKVRYRDTPNDPFVGDRAAQKLSSMYRWDVEKYVSCGNNMIYYSPSANSIRDLISQQKENIRKEQAKKVINETGL
jgi:hypothetical protein